MRYRFDTDCGVCELVDPTVVPHGETGSKFDVNENIIGFIMRVKLILSESSFISFTFESEILPDSYEPDDVLSWAQDRLAEHAI